MGDGMGGGRGGRFWDAPIFGQNPCKIDHFPTKRLGTSPPLTRVSGALSGRNTEKVSKMSPGASGPGPQKGLQKVSGRVWEVSGESPESVWRVFWDCPRDFLETFSGSRAGGFGRHFRDFFGLSGPEGVRDPCKGRAGSQQKDAKSGRPKNSRSYLHPSHPPLDALLIINRA